jgi:molybdenum cofactor biosynthesis enzyme MoaA
MSLLNVVQCKQCKKHRLTTSKKTFMCFHCNKKQKIGIIKFTTEDQNKARSLVKLLNAKSNIKIKIKT